MLAYITLHALLVLGAAAPPAAPRATPTLKADAEGYCQRTEFVAWSADGSEAAYTDSYCKEPPIDAAWDTTYVVARDGRIRRWLIGAQAGAALPRETRAKLLFEGPVSKADPKAPKTGLVAKGTVEHGVVVIAFTAPKGKVPPPPLKATLRLPYPDWPDVKPPSIGSFHWSPDGGALAIVVRGVKKEPGGGKLEVATVFFAQVIEKR